MNTRTFAALALAGALATAGSAAQAQTVLTLSNWVRRAHLHFLETQLGAVGHGEQRATLAGAGVAAGRGDAVGMPGQDLAQACDDAPLAGALDGGHHLFAGEGAGDQHILPLVSADGDAVVVETGDVDLDGRQLGARARAAGFLRFLRCFGH
jgi:hypothetical protein